MRPCTTKLSTAEPQELDGGKAKKSKGALSASFHKETASLTGKAERTIQEKSQIGTRLKPLAKTLTQTPVADKQKELLALTHLGEAERVEVVERLHTGQATTVRGAYQQRQAEALAQEPPPLPTGAKGKRSL